MQKGDVNIENRGQKPYQYIFNGGSHHVEAGPGVTHSSSTETVLLDLPPANHHLNIQVAFPPTLHHVVSRHVSPNTVAWGNNNVESCEDLLGPGQPGFYGIIHQGCPSLPPVGIKCSRRKSAKCHTAFVFCGDLHWFPNMFRVKDRARWFSVKLGKLPYLQN